LAALSWAKYYEYPSWQKPNNGVITDIQALMVIEDWQQDLKKITLRMVYTDSEDGARKTYERHIFRHRERVME
jgi:hypothetical protein